MAADEERQKRANRAAAALQAHIDEVNGAPGVSYGDEGSDTFVGAVAELLLDVKFLLDRAGGHLMLTDMTEDAVDRWAQIEDEDDGTP